jgi:hypothetical protein
MLPAPASSSGSTANRIRKYNDIRRIITLTYYSPREDH